jgi:hypothetical protein
MFYYTEFHSIFSKPCLLTLKQRLWDKEVTSIPVHSCVLYTVFVVSHLCLICTKSGSQSLALGRCGFHQSGHTAHFLAE